MENNIRIGRVRKNALSSFVRIAQVTEAGKERFPVLALQLETFRADPTIPVMRPAFTQAKRMDHPIPVKPVILSAWCKLGV